MPRDELDDRYAHAPGGGDGASDGPGRERHTPGAEGGGGTCPVPPPPPPAMPSIRESEALEATFFEPRAPDSPRSPSTPQTPLSVHSTPEELDNFLLEPRPARRGLSLSWSPTVLLEQFRETTPASRAGSAADLVLDFWGDALNDQMGGGADQMTSTTDNMLLVDIG